MALLDIATLCCDESNIPELEKVLLKLLHETHEKDQGILLYEMFVEDDAKDRYTFLEIYQDQKAFDAHLVAAHVKEGQAGFNPLLSKPAVFDLYEFIDNPGTPFPVWSDCAFAVTTVLPIKQGEQEAFEDTAKEIVPTVQPEANGCLFRRLVRGKGDRCRYAVWEFFATKAALDEHMKGIEERNATTKPFSAGDPEVRTLRLRKRGVEK